MILGIDASTYLEELDHGAKYYDKDTEIDPLDAFVANGVDYMRIRIWNDPKSPEGEPYLAGNCDIDNYVKLGKLAASKGYKLLMDLHYSDFWADPGKQIIPKAWADYSVDEMVEAVYPLDDYEYYQAAGGELACLGIEKDGAFYVGGQMLLVKGQQILAQTETVDVVITVTDYRKVG